MLPQFFEQQVPWVPEQETPAPLHVVHTPEAQRAAGPPGQTFPQEPQFSTSVSVSRHVDPHRVRPLAHPHAPPVQTLPLPQAFPQPPQFFALVCVSTHLDPHSAPEPPHAHWPPWQIAPAPIVVTHASSDVGSSSTMPLQSLSLPSQSSGAYVHWQTSLVCPASGAQVHPATQVTVVVQVVVQTLPVQPGPPAWGSPTGWQIKSGQSEFLLQGSPVLLLAGGVQTPPEQTRPGVVQAPPSQQASATAPQEPLPEEAPDPEPEPDVEPELDPEPELAPDAEPELDAQPELDPDPPLVDAGEVPPSSRLPPIPEPEDGVHAGTTLATHKRAAAAADQVEGRFMACLSPRHDTRRRRGRGFMARWRLLQRAQQISPLPHELLLVQAQPVVEQTWVS